MAQIQLLLELSDRHLPPGLADTLTATANLHISWTAFGTLLRVPTHEQLSRATGYLPADIIVILRYARDLDCDYVLIDPDADIDADLPAWDR
jgi:hypothetical protein